MIHFDGWTSTYDYVCTPDSTDIHPLGWLYATTHKLGTPSGKTIRLQEPKRNYLNLCNNLTVEKHYMSHVTLNDQ